MLKIPLGGNQRQPAATFSPHRCRIFAAMNSLMILLSITVLLSKFNKLTGHTDTDDTDDFLDLSRVPRMHAPSTREISLKSSVFICILSVIPNVMDNIKKGNAKPESGDEVRT